MLVSMRVKKNKKQKDLDPIPRGGNVKRVRSITQLEIQCQGG